VLLLLCSSVAVASLEQAQQDYNRGHYEDAVAAWKLLAQEDSSEAQFRLANAYRFGLGVKSNEAAAYRWMSRAADAGNGSAISALKFMRKVEDTEVAELPIASTQVLASKPSLSVKSTPPVAVKPRVVSAPKIIVKPRVESTAPPKVMASEPIKAEKTATTLVVENAASEVSAEGSEVSIVDEISTVAEVSEGDNGDVVIGNRKSRLFDRIMGNGSTKTENEPAPEVGMAIFEVLDLESFDFDGAYVLEQLKKYFVYATAIFVVMVVLGFYPFVLIHRKAGIPGRMTAVLFIPIVGVLIELAILVFKDWPNTLDEA